MLVADEEAALELGQGFWSGDAFDLSPVFAEVAVGGVQEFLIEGGFVAEEEEAFAIGVEAADGVDVFWEVECGECGPLGVGLRGELGEGAVGFVEG